MSEGLYHLNWRKRFFNKAFREYPHQNFWIRSLDKLLLVVAILGPIAALPQVFHLFATKATDGLSLFSWISFTILNVPWIIYGIVHKERPIITAYVLWFLINLSMSIGIIIYS